MRVEAASLAQAVGGRLERLRGLRRRDGGGAAQLLGFGGHALHGLQLDLEGVDLRRCFAQRASTVLGSAWAFCGAVLVIVVWLVTGPTFHFSDTWQLIINTATTVITFLMVFLIQNTQNRDAKAQHLKLDELIRAVKGARNQLVDLEELSDNDLKKLEEQFRRLRKHSENSRTGSDNGQPARSR